jgi:hypothetical protein
MAQARMCEKQSLPHQSKQGGAVTTGGFQPIQLGNQVAMPGTMKTATSSNTLMVR